jgi:hypothetical protein
MKPYEAFAKTRVIQRRAYGLHEECLTLTVLTCTLPAICAKRVQNLPTRCHEDALLGTRVFTYYDTPRGQPDMIEPSLWTRPVSDGRLCAAAAFATSRLTAALGD